MNIPIVIQARMSSARLPGKVLHRVAGKPLLRFLIDRLQTSSRGDTIWVATSQNKDDDPIAAYCASEMINCHRGPLENVAERFKQLVERLNVPHFVRLSADSPLLDPAVLDRGMNLFEGGEWDLVTNIFPRSFPKGQSVEILRTDAFFRGFSLMKEPGDTEHVTPVFYRHADRFRIKNFPMPGPPQSNLNLSVDTLDDLRQFELFVSACGTDPRTCRLEDLIHLKKSLA